MCFFKPARMLLLSRSSSKFRVASECRQSVFNWRRLTNSISRLLSKLSLSMDIFPSYSILKRLMSWSMTVFKLKGRFEEANFLLMSYLSVFESRHAQWSESMMTAKSGSRTRCVLSLTMSWLTCSMMASVSWVDFSFSIFMFGSCLGSSKLFERRPICRYCSLWRDFWAMKPAKSRSSESSRLRLEIL